MLSEGRKNFGGDACEGGQGRGDGVIMSFGCWVSEVRNPTSIIKKSFHLEAVFIGGHRQAGDVRHNDARNRQRARVTERH